MGAIAAASLPLLAGCGGSHAANPTPTLPPIGGSPVAAVPGYEDPSRWSGRRLRVGAFGGEIQAALQSHVWTPFETLTGCQIVSLTSDFAQLAASYDASGEPYADVLLADAFWAYGALAQNLVDAVPAGRVDPRRISAVTVFDGALPAYAYAMVDSFRRDVVAGLGAPDSWGKWWDGDTYPGGRSLPKGPLGSFEFALLADGVDRKSLYPLDGARAIEKLKAISGKIVDLWWETGDQPLIWMDRQRADLTAAWHYRDIAAQADGRPVDFNWDDGLLIADYWVVPKSAPAADVAWDFLAFALSSQVQASLATAIPLGPVVDDAFPLLDAKTRLALPTSPDHRGKLIQADVAWWAANKVEANERFNSWLLGVPMNEG
jgi:putative spermidine/putrescine transport system substrate-binding protein